MKTPTRIRTDGLIRSEELFLELPLPLPVQAPRSAPEKNRESGTGELVPDSYGSPLVPDCWGTDELVPRRGR